MDQTQIEATGLYISKTQPMLAWSKVSFIFLAFKGKEVLFEIKKT